MIDRFLAEIANTDLTAPKPDRIKGAYTTRPGPKKRPAKVLESHAE
jgi:hypothetical protein